jgi:hypothetical protein
MKRLAVGSAALALCPRPAASNHQIFRFFFFHSNKSEMTDFGELALVVGDFHIPHRAVKIPEKFQRMLVPNKMQRKSE